MMLDTQGVADLLGVSPATVRAYRSRGLLPPPDGFVARSPWWSEGTIRAWMASRPGRGAGGGRPRKHPEEGTGGGA